MFFLILCLSLLNFSFLFFSFPFCLEDNVWWTPVQRRQKGYCAIIKSIARLALVLSGVSRNCLSAISVGLSQIDCGHFDVWVSDWSN